MFNKRPKVVLLVFGKGGHTAQMTRFLSCETNSFIENNYVTLTNSNKPLPRVIDTFFSVEARDKHSLLKNVFLFFAYIFLSTFQMIRIISKYKIVGMISTGPGMAIIPGIICKLKRTKVVYFESWSRFSKPAIAGRIMYHIAHLFFIQHKSIQKYYPKAIYSGRL